MQPKRYKVTYRVLADISYHLEADSADEAFDMANKLGWDEHDESVPVVTSQDVYTATVQVWDKELGWVRADIGEETSRA